MANEGIPAQPLSTKARLGLAISVTLNALCRFADITGGTKNSGIIVDESNNVTGVGALTVAGTLAPSTNNTRTNGTAALQWSDVRSVLGTFTGKLLVNNTAGAADALHVQSASTSAGMRIERTASSTGTVFIGAQGDRNGANTFDQCSIFNSLTSKSVGFAGYDSGELRLVLNGYDRITSDAPFTPATDNTRTLGTAALRWSDVRSVLGTFTGTVRVTDGTLITDILPANIQLHRPASISYIDVTGIGGEFRLRTSNAGTLDTTPLTITSSGAVTLASTLTVTGAVTASAGISLGNETLSTYDEGTFTPTIAGDSVAGVNTYTLQVGRYIRIGKRVFADFGITMSVKDGAMAGNIYIGGLPFTVLNVSGYQPGASLGLVENITFAGSLTIRGEANTTRAFLGTLISGGAFGNIAPGAIAATTIIRGTITYEVV